jgi:CheY-like chemotaxis protein
LQSDEQVIRGFLTNKGANHPSGPAQGPRKPLAASGGGETSKFAAPATDEDDAPRAAVRPVILVVDDDVDIREALEETLEDHGFRVRTATNGVDALRLLRTMSSSPALILLDLMMPIMDGYGFLDERRKDTALASVPVVVITAGHGFDRSRLGETTPILPKPIKVPQLINTLRAYQANGTPT